MRLGAAVAVLGSAALVACGPGPVAAEVGGRSISAGSIDRETALLGLVPGYAATLAGAGRGPVSTTDVLTRRIDLTVVDAEVHRRHLVIDPAATRAAGVDAAAEVNDAAPGGWQRLPGWYREQLIARSAQVTALEVSLGMPAPTDAVLRAVYQRDASTVHTTRCVEHLLVADDAAAMAAGARLAAGESFSALASQVSIDRGSAASGGTLGCGTAAVQHFTAPFEQAVESQVAGRPGPPVHTRFGVHLIEVLSRATPPFEQVREQERLRWLAGGDNRVAERVAALLGATTVTVAPRYGTFDAAGPTPGVVPPRGAGTRPPTNRPALVPPGGNSGTQQAEPND